MYCNNCGKKLSEDSLFCSSCGARVEPEADTEQTTWTYSDEYSGINDYQPERRRLTPGARAVILIIIVIVLIPIINNTIGSGGTGHRAVVQRQKVYTVTIDLDLKTGDVIVREFIDGQLFNYDALSFLYVLAGDDALAEIYINAAKEKGLADVYMSKGEVY